MWSTAQGWKRAMDPMLMLGLNEAIDRLCMAIIFHWFIHVLKREYGHVFEDECHWKIGRYKRTWKKLVEEETMIVGLSRRMHFVYKK